MGNLQVINYDDANTLKVIRDSVAHDATPSEFAYFLEYCKHTGLNPIKREIWFIKDNKGRVQVMTGINGFLAIANANPNFDGMEVEFEDGPNGTPVACVCRVWRKDRSHAHIEKVYMAEYNQKFGTWLTKPRTMLAKVAKAHALREAFSQELAGVYIEEEMPNTKDATSREKNAGGSINTYVYKVSAIQDEGKREALLKILQDKGLELVICNEAQYFETDQKLEKLEECRVEKIGD